MAAKDRNNIYVLIHSPLVGTPTWTLVAEEMRRRGLQVILPALVDVPDARDPFWNQHAESVAQALTGIPTDVSVTMVGHSGAGPLLPVIRRSIPNPVHAYVFVDAGLPRDNATRLDLMKAEDAAWAAEFQKYLESGGLFPNWTSEDLVEILPDENLRNQLAASLRPRDLDFFKEPIPVFGSWPDAPCAYILFSAPYRVARLEAQRMGWQTEQLDAGHFHMLVDPPAVTELILNAINKIVPTSHG